MKHLRNLQNPRFWLVPLLVPLLQDKPGRSLRS